MVNAAVSSRRLNRENHVKNRIFLGKVLAAVSQEACESGAAERNSTEVIKPDLYLLAIGPQLG